MSPFKTRSQNTSLQTDHWGKIIQMWQRGFFFFFFVNVGSWNVYASVTMTRQNRSATSQLGSKHASINGLITIQIEQHQISSDATAKILTMIFPLFFTQKKRYNKFQYTWQLNELWSAYFNTQPTPCYHLTRWKDIKHEIQTPHLHNFQATPRILMYACI